MKFAGPIFVKVPEDDIVNEPVISNVFVVAQTEPVNANSESPLNPEVPDEPFSPLTPDVPLVPDVPDEPFSPLTPDVPLVPLLPLTPLIPLLPLTPEVQPAVFPVRFHASAFRSNPNTTAQSLQACRLRHKASPRRALLCRSALCTIRSVQSVAYLSLRSCGAT